MNNNNQINLSKRIIEHLRLNKDRRDELDGIVIAIYEKEMKKLSEKIIYNLAEFIAKGIIIENVDQNGKRYYKLIKQ